MSLEYWEVLEWNYTTLHYNLKLAPVGTNLQQIAIYYSSFGSIKTRKNPLNPARKAGLEDQD